MKNRSYKISTNDDWVEESWTVDCVCGVNFDDGEEMVNCDDCGVWVHTRCSNYVKSEKSFACDKCKNRKTRNNSEETEVAQMLVDLPTKTLRMDNPTTYVPPPKLPSAPTLAPSYIRPCRQWTEIPIKERVHIQGIPGVGDDPSIFSGVSSVFSPQLWKCAGYVPKKFNFPYKEFPDWEDGEEDLQKKNGVVSLDVGILISSNSEIPSDPPEVSEECCMKTKNGDVEHDKHETPEQAPKLDSTVSVVLKPCLGVTKDPVFLQSSPVQCGKRKENSGMLKDRSGKKKVKTMENQGEIKKNMQFLGPASTNSSDVRKLQWNEERGHGSQKDDPIGNQISKSSDTIRGHQLSGNNPVDHHSNDHKSNSGSSKNCVMEQSLDASIDHSTRKEITKEGKCGSSSPEKSKNLSCGISAEGQVAINSDAIAAKFEGRLPTDVRINLNKSEIVSKDVPIIHTKVLDNCELNLQPLPIVDYKSITGEIQTQSKKIYSDSPINSSEDFSGPKNTSKKFESKTSDEPLTCNGSIRAVSPVFGNCTSADVTYEDSAGKPKKNSEGNVGNYKDNDNSTVEEESPNRQKILLTKPIKSSLGSVTKSTQIKTPPFHSSNSKKTFSEPVTVSAASTLPPVPALSASPPQYADVNNSQPEIGSDVEKKGSSKNVNGSVLSQKVEKTNQNVPMTSSKVNTSLAHVATTSSNSSATLTDEELALLLHQELNSSPRVPRVPRMRHAGSLPQLTSPTVSTIMKRTSSIGGKEHGSGPRRRDKEFPKDNPEGDDENKTTTEWAPYISDHGGGQDSGWTPRLPRDIGNGSSAKSTATTSNSPVETTVNRPPRNPSDDNMCTTAPRTLPGLIAEIMSKGERMMYEDLCNAVLPHWPNLRKHNGERYAYASHSQGVLDCLRNRIEWARLVDRGPKTCVGRRRRKVVSDLPGIDLEDNEDNRVKNYRVNKSHEESPKGKREESRKWRSQKGGRAAAATTATTTTTTTTSRSSSRRRRVEEFSDDDEAESYLSCSEDTTISNDDEADDDEDDDDEVTTTTRDGTEVSKRSSDGI